VGIVPSVYVYHDARVQLWKEIMWNKKRMMTIYQSELKDIQGSLKGNLLVFLKRRFDELTGHLLFRQFKLFAFRFKLVFAVISQFKQIHNARKTSINEGAFL
jgi:hypothetical protein